MLPITILIPTMNRPDYLLRALTYYRVAGFDGCILIGDSSEGEAAERVREIAGRFGGERYRVRLFHYPRSVTLLGVWRAMIAAVDTKYVTFAGDDDLQIPGGLRAGIAFLEKEPGYAGAKCMMVELWTGQKDPYGEIAGAFLTPFPDYDTDSAARRLFTYAQMTLSVQYGIYRTEVWRAAYDLVPEPYLPYFGEEFIPCAACVVLGKLKSLPNFGTIQQVDGSGGVWKRQTMFDLIRAPEWPALSRLFQSRMAELLTKIERIVPEDAQRLTEQVLWWHVGMFMNHHYEVRHEGRPVEERQSDPDLLAGLDRSQEFALIRAMFRRDHATSCQA
jgi:glycosyltransferase domain-containing protein